MVGESQPDFVRELWDEIRPNAIEQADRVVAGRTRLGLARQCARVGVPRRRRPPAGRVLGSFGAGGSRGARDGTGRPAPAEDAPDRPPSSRPRLACARPRARMSARKPELGTTPRPRHGRPGADAGGCAAGDQAPQLGAIDSALNAGPEKDSTAYATPAAGEADAVAAAVLDLVEGRDADVPEGYSVMRQKDVDVLAEKAVDGRTRGWGLSPFGETARRPSSSRCRIPAPTSSRRISARSCSHPRRRERFSWPVPTALPVTVPPTSPTSRARSSRTSTAPSFGPAGPSCNCTASRRRRTMSEPRPWCPVVGDAGARRRGGRGGLRPQRDHHLCL